MASRVVFFVVLAIIFPAIAFATNYMVGDDKGWTSYFDYQAWAQGKDFRVGDSLVFQYPTGVHNVFEVNETGFKNCIKPSLNEALTSGNDKIVLTTPGQKWYIGGVDQDCSVGGQKLFVTVNFMSLSSSGAPQPQPSDTFSRQKFFDLPIFNPPIPFCPFGC